MTDWKRVLPAVAPKARADIVAAFVRLDAEIAAAGITTDLRVAHFLAQIVPESWGLTRLEEGLSYSAERLCVVWKSRFPTLASAKPYARNPVKLAERVYGGRMGNVRPGDGYRYRGGGLAMTTGRKNYRAAGFEDRPEALRTPEYALRSALTFWTDNGCAAFADRDDVAGLRRVWNGGDIGLVDTKAVLAAAKRVLRTLPAQAQLKALRYPVGKVDGDHGTRTTGAVAAFQAREALPVTGDLDDATVERLAVAEPIPPAAKDADLSQSRTIQGATLAGGCGLAQLVSGLGDIKAQLVDAQTHFAAGSWIEAAIGAAILAGAGYAVYARWDDAGRPVPGLLARRFPGLVGGV